MRVEDCIVDVKCRGAAGCIDLACVFQRRFVGPIINLLLIFAVPSLVIGWLILQYRDFSLVWMLLVWSFFSSLFCGALIAGIGPQVFGQPFRVNEALQSLRRRLPLYFVWVLLIRILQVFLSLCFVLPATLIAPFTGFLAEVMFLEQTPAGKIYSRMSALSKNYFTSLLIRYWLVLIFVVILVAGLFTSIFFLGTFLFNLPGLADRLDRRAEDPISLLISLFSDPFAGTVLQACFWCVTPLARLAWFFMYLDSRIRRECWDLDVAFQIEARRLEVVK